MVRLTRSARHIGANDRDAPQSQGLAAYEVRLDSPHAQRSIQRCPIFVTTQTSSQTSSQNPKNAEARSRRASYVVVLIKNFWLRGQDLNLRPLGYEPNELPGCSTPRLSLKV
jgi:hypothetical protein